MSRIGNRRILQALASAFGIEGVRKRVPISLNEDQVQVVTPIEAGWANYTPWMVESLVDFPIDGLGGAAWTWVVVGLQTGTGVDSPPADATRLANPDEEVVILGMEVILRYDVAGAAADAFERIDVIIRRSLTPAGTPVQVSTLKPAWTIQSGEEQYSWSYPLWFSDNHEVVGATSEHEMAGYAGPPLWVPAGTTLEVVVSREAAGAYPANTEAHVTAWGIASPRGFRPPGI